MCFEAEPGITAYGDKMLLKILLTNLLQNAWKYTEPIDDARIELGVVEDESDGPIYHVRDNGIGFAKADCEVIFEAFERLHTQGEFAGSGLGAGHRRTNRAPPWWTSVGRRRPGKGSGLPLHPRTTAGGPS